MSNIKFILLLGASPPGPPTGLCPCTLLGALATPRPLTCVGAFGPRSRLLSKYHRLLQILLTALEGVKFIPGERSPTTNVSRAQFLDPASYVD